jgi:hypothetical protein
MWLASRFPHTHLQLHVSQAVCYRAVCNETLRQPRNVFYACRKCVSSGFCRGLNEIFALL